LSKRAKVLLLKYGASWGFILLAAAAYVLDRCAGGARLSPLGEWFHAVGEGMMTAEAVDWFHWLCDGLTLPSILVLSVGLMIWISNAGMFDLLSFTVSSFFQLFVSDDKRKHGTYGDYVAERKEKRVRGYSFLLITGAASMGLTLLFLLLYTMVK
jgi:hypothetical protein